MTVPVHTSASATRASGPPASPMIENRPSPGRCPVRPLSSQNAYGPARNSASNAASPSHPVTTRSTSRSKRRTGAGRTASAAGRAEIAGARFTGARRGRAVRASETKLASSRSPWRVSIDSGWNCTPHIGRVRCRSAISTPSGVCASASSSAGSLVTVSEW